MKRTKVFLSLLLTFALVLTIVPLSGISVSANDEPVLNSEGYYEISTASHLYWFAEQVNSGNNTINGVLMNDIVVNGNVLVEGALNTDETVVSTFREWTPIGTSKVLYQGVFDGQNYTISGLYFNDSSAECIGLFGASSSTIKNISVTDSYFYGGVAVAGIVGYYSDGTIENCCNESLIEGIQGVGGIAGLSDGGVITNCKNIGDISGTTIVGGIFGLGDDGATITNCNNSGIISASSYLGGIAGGFVDGSGTYGEITNCYNRGNIITLVADGNNYTGGIVGRGPVIATSCYNTGTVVGVVCAGGIGGCGVSAIDCYNVGDISGHAGIGGIVGENLFSLNNCYNIGSISGEFATGSIAGLIYDYEGVSNCYYLKGSAVDVNGVVQNGSGSEKSGSSTEDIDGATTTKTAEDFASGEVAYLLNNGLSDGTQVWYQNIDNGETVDATPKFIGGTVYNCVHNCSETKEHYTNNLDCAGKLHSFENGVCLKCDVSCINPWKSQIRFDKNEDGTFAGTFDYRVFATITRDDLIAVFGSEENAEKMIVETGFVMAKGTDVSDFDYETAKAVVKGESMAYTKVNVNVITTFFDTDKSISASGDYVISCIVEDVPQVDKNMYFASMAYIAYNDKNGEVCYMFYPTIDSVCFTDLYDKYYSLAFPS